MPRYGQLVMGPAGCGKSTYCSNIVKHCEAVHRTVLVVNLDPAAEHFDYPVYADIRELIHIDDAMEDEALHFGPNGGLIFCMEGTQDMSYHALYLFLEVFKKEHHLWDLVTGYLIQNLDWLREQLDEVEDDYILFDLPGQIELYTHIPVMRQLADELQNWNFRLCGIFLLDAQFLVEPSKFVSGALTALSAMVSLEIPHLNVMSKLDLLSKKEKKGLERYLEPDVKSLLAEEFDDAKFGHRFKALNASIASLIDDYSLVKFFPLDPTDEESINDILVQADMTIQYGEDMEPKEYREPQEPDDDRGVDIDSGID